ncbi:MAG: hypothetical protein ACYC63_20680 [Armatimonadota bacterium]
MPDTTRRLVKEWADEYALHDDDRSLLVSRVDRGFVSYGETNHLQPGYKADQELREEALDAFAQVVFGVRRHEYTARRANALASLIANVLEVLRIPGGKMVEDVSSTSNND